MSRTYRRAGFTLIEVIISTFLMTALLGAVVMVYNFGFDISYSQWKRTGIKGETGRTLAALSAELRRATSIVTGQALQRSIRSTVDYDGNGAEETIEYRWDNTAGSPLNRTFTSTVPVVNSTAAVVNYVDSMAFSYYDSNDNLLTFPVTASQVRAVAVTITVTDGDETFTLRSKVKLRNI
ncbi:MAG: prepilin-type N-terminal cleavage/methylation domain-containing protein [Candidatus Omnitrophota bacterium]|jgi:type II secretory pathway component PulJ